MKKPRARILALIAAVPLVLSVGAATASAHVEFTPNTIPPEDGALVTLAFSHDCGGKGTTSLEMKIPEGVTLFRPAITSGWTITQEGAKGMGGMADMETASAATTVKWTHDGGPVPTDASGVLSAVVATAKDSKDLLWFPVVQTCPGGQKLSWIQTADTADGAEDLDFPAPHLEVVMDGAAPATAVKTVATGSAVKDAKSAKETATSARNLAIGALILSVLVGGIALVGRGRKRD